jgi:hypothetical protein
MKLSYKKNFKNVFGALTGASSHSGVKTPMALEYNSNKNKSFK